MRHNDAAITGAWKNGRKALQHDESRVRGPHNMPLRFALSQRESKRDRADGESCRTWHTDVDLRPKGRRADPNHSENSVTKAAWAAVAAAFRPATVTTTTGVAGRRRGGEWHTYWFKRLSNLCEVLNLAAKAKTMEKCYSALRCECVFAILSECERESERQKKSQALIIGAQD